MSRIQTFCRKGTCSLCSLMVPFLIIAQKLPGKQQVSMRAPAGLKIDGKTTEWNDHFQAYNDATSIYYTIANDDDNLYLAIQVRDVDVLSKVTIAGIRLTVNKLGVKDDKNAVGILFPYFQGAHRPYIGVRRLLQVKPGSDVWNKETDSVMRSWNNKLDVNTKEIKVSGISGVDSTISVYNDTGINARQAFDTSLHYNYEIAIPLKLLDININYSKKLAYHIVLRGTTSDDFGLKMEYGPDGKEARLISAPGSGPAFLPNSHLAATGATTDLWGEYVLAKK